MGILITLILNTLAVFVTAYILPGVKLESLTTAFVVAVVLGAVNAFLRPIIFILTIPINFLTLGLFTFVIMAFMVMLVSAIVPGFEVGGFWRALAFALVLAIINNFIDSLTTA